MDHPHALSRIANKPLNHHSFTQTDRLTVMSEVETYLPRTLRYAYT